METEKEQTVLIVSSSEKGAEFIRKNPGAAVNAFVATSGVEARRMLAEREYNAVVINAPLRDETGEELAENVIKDTYAGVLLLVKAEAYEAAAFAAEKFGAFCLPKPISAQAFAMAMRLTLAANARVKLLMKKTLSLKEKMEEIKLVSRAKLLLVSKLSF
ncbi:MAG: response regulator receiver protein, partial [Candidatus Scatosoma sp.]